MELLRSWLGIGTLYNVYETTLKEQRIYKGVLTYWDWTLGFAEHDPLSHMGSRKGFRMR